MKTVEAVIETNGEVHLLELVCGSSRRRALDTILAEAPTVHDAALLSEAALAEDWNRAARKTPPQPNSPGPSAGGTNGSQFAELM